MGRFFGFINRMFAAIGSWFQSPVVLLLRLFFGTSLVITGLGKLQALDKFHDYLVSLSVPYPEVTAWAVALTETIGGSLLVIGFLSRFASLALICVLIGAYATAHIESIHSFFSDPKLFVSQPPFDYLVTVLIVFAFGPGYFSVDQLFLNPAPKIDSGK